MLYDLHGELLPGSGGYFYFGAAKDLPGVRELFQKQAPPPPKKNLQQLYKNIDFEYYGATGQEDEDLAKEEMEYEKKLREATI